MNRIDLKFQQLQKQRKKAFIAFLTAGFPSLATTADLIKSFDKLGVDLLELGVPFSDPLADGPVIQYASQFALKHKVTLSKILDLIKKIRSEVSLPLLLMSYYNPIFSFEYQRFVDTAVRCGVDGVIVPDLPPEEATDFIRYARKKNLNIVFFLAPTSSLKRIRYISRIAQGFIYYVSLTGVTGIRRKLPADIARNLRLIKRYTNKPICVGFGVSRPQQIKYLWQFADGVIVGSAIVKKIQDSLGEPNLVQRVSRFVRWLMGR